MMKWFRKHNKQLLAVFASALLVVWLGGSALQRLFQPNPFKETVGRAYGQTVTVAQAGHIRASLDLLKSLGMQWEYPWRNPWVLGQLDLPRDVQHDPIATAGAQPLRDGMDWWLLAEEARRMGVTISQEQVGDFLTQTKIPTEVLTQVRDSAKMSTEAFFETIGEYLRVCEAAVLASASVQATEAEARDLFVRTNDKVRIRYALLPAESFRSDPDEEIPEAELQDLFDQYKDNLPGSGKYGIGYKHPQRAVVEYAGGDMQQVAQALPTPTEEALRRYFEPNRAKFQPPPPPTTRPAATQPEVKFEEVRGQVVEQLKSRRAADLIRRAMDDIRGAIFAEYSRSSSALASGQVPPSLETILKQALDKAQADSGAPLVYKRTEPLSEEQAGREPGISNASAPESQGQALPFAKYAFRVQESDATRDEAAEQGLWLKLYQPSTFLRNMMGNELRGQYIFRVVKVVPAQAPESLAEVRDQVVRDARMLRTIKQAREAAEKLLAAAQADGLEEAFKQQFPALATRPATTQPGETGQIKLLGPPEPVARERPVPPFFASFVNRLTFPTDLPGMRETEPILEAAFDLVGESATQPAQAASLVELPGARAYAVVHLLEHAPATVPEFARAKEQLLGQLRLLKLREFYAAWFNPKMIEQRTNWQPTTIAARPGGRAPMPPPLPLEE